MNGRTWLYVSGGAAAVAVATLGIAACSGESTLTHPTADAGRLDTSIPDTSRPDTSTADGAVPDGAGGDAGACAHPPKLFPPSSAGVYCPFSKGDGGKALDCTPTSQVCCMSPTADAGSSTCSAPGACPTGWGDWACSAPQECSGSGVVCCLAAGPLEADLKCSGFQKTKGFSSTSCMATAMCTGTIDAGKHQDNLYVACEAQSDCPQGKTCTAIKTTGTSIGVCL